MNLLQRDEMEAEELKVLIRKALGFFVADRWLQKKDSRAKQYHINHIQISPYNSRANGPVE